MLLSVLFSVKNILPQALLLVLFMCPISFYNQPIEKRRFVRLLGLDFFDFRGKILLYES